MTVSKWLPCVLVLVMRTDGKLNPGTNTDESGENNVEDSYERIGASITQVYRHPYAASLLKDGEYICSAVILNTYWLLTQTKCFDPAVIKSYVTHEHLTNYTVRVGSSYNNKGGDTNKIKMLISNFDMKVSGLKLERALEFGPRVSAVRLPAKDEELTLGYLVSMVAWTPNGHMRLVNAAAIEVSICESYTTLQPGQYICVGGVQDLNRHFCRRDNGGAVIQNKTLVGITTFIQRCAMYTKTHAFPKIATIVHWLNSVIWDEDNRPTTSTTTTKRPTTSPTVHTGSTSNQRSGYFEDPMLLTLPFDPINVPLEPAEDNSVIPRMSLYEAYLQSLSRKRTSTTLNPNMVSIPYKDFHKKEWIQKLNKAIMMMPPPAYTAEKYQEYDVEN